MGALYVGLDLGGTKICAVGVDADGTVRVGPVEQATGRQRAPGAIMATMVEAVEAVCAQAAGTVAGIGIGIPTTLQADGGLVPCPNLPTMGGIHIGSELEQRLGRGIVLENDANSYAYGEWRAGAARGSRYCCCLTLGTGLGMGMILDGRLYTGPHGSAGELCYSPLDAEREAEDVVSGMGVTRRYAELTGQEQEGAEIARRARQGEAEAMTVWTDLGTALGFALAYTVNIVDPEVVVLGGSLAAAHDLFSAPMEQVLKQRAYDRAQFRLVTATLGKQAAAIGAAMLAMDRAPATTPHP